jgi:quinoprotein glucose dehydrogenase
MSMSRRNIKSWEATKRVAFFACFVIFVSVLSVVGDAAWPRAVAKDRYAGWTTYLGNPDASHYSSLTQINKSNVSQLKVAWSYDAGNERPYEFNPLIVDKTMYVVAKRTSVVALDAQSGRELWTYRSADAPLMEVHRGINFWQSKNGSDQRLLIPFNDHLEAIDAHSGQLIRSFGDNGKVDLRAGLGRDPKTIVQIQSGTPGQIFKNLIILGSSTGEEYGSPPGDIRAYDVRSGKLVWTFHTIPYPGEFGHETWPEGAWQKGGGANCWGEMSLDEDRGIVYIPTGAPVYDFYGSDRKGNNLFADSLLALDARTGKLKWHFQFVHHDLWDYDETAAPQLLTVRHDGKDVPVVAQATKQGFLYVFNRETGKPIWPIEERPVSVSKVANEWASPTQPFPTKPAPFARQKFTVAEINPYILSPADREHWTNVVGGAINQGLFTPPGFTDTIEMPGNHGGVNWGMTASDPSRGWIFVYSMDLPAILKLEHRLPPQLWEIPTDAPPLKRGAAVYHAYCERCHGADHKGAPPAIPSLENAPTVYGENLIKSVIHSGYKDMPAYPDLYETLIHDLVQYLGQPVTAAALAEQQTATKEARETPQVSAQKRYWSGYGLQPSIISPPWSTITAFDLNDGSIKWKAAIGDSPAASAQGLAGSGVMMPRNGPVVTAAGLIFIATRDEGKLRALDEETGKELWSFEMPAGSEGVPAVYQVEGQEYLVVCATSAKVTEIPRDGPPPPTAESVKRSYIAFGLPTRTGSAQ